MDKQMERRVFIKRLGRLGLFSGLLALGGVFVLKRQLTLEHCEEGDVCRQCPKENACQLPQATKQRKHD